MKESKFRMFIGYIIFLAIVELIGRYYFTFEHFIQTKEGFLIDLVCVLSAAVLWIIFGISGFYRIKDNK